MKEIEEINKEMFYSPLDKILPLDKKRDDFVEKNVEVKDPEEFLPYLFGRDYFLSRHISDCLQRSWRAKTELWKCKKIVIDQKIIPINSGGYYFLQKTPDPVEIGWNHNQIKYSVFDLDDGQEIGDSYLPDYEFKNMYFLNQEDTDMNRYSHCSDHRTNHRIFFKKDYDRVCDLYLLKNIWEIQFFPDHPISQYTDKKIVWGMTEEYAPAIELEPYDLESLSSLGQKHWFHYDRKWK